MRRPAAQRVAVLAALVGIVLAGAALRGWQAAHPRLAHEAVDERVYAALARTLAEDLHYGDRSTGPRHPFIAAPGAPVAFAAARRLTPSRLGSPTDIPAAYWLLAAVGTGLIGATFALGQRLGGGGPGRGGAAGGAVPPAAGTDDRRAPERAVRGARAHPRGPGARGRAQRGTPGAVRGRRRTARADGAGASRPAGRAAGLPRRAPGARRPERSPSSGRRRRGDRARGRRTGDRALGRIRLGASGVARPRRRDGRHDAAGRRLPAR